MSNQNWAASLIASDRRIEELEAEAVRDEERRMTDEQREAEVQKFRRRLPSGHQDHFEP